MTNQRHTVSLMVDNQPGVLSRIAGMFSGRGFNIESLCVAQTTDPLISRITLTTSGNDMVIEQVIKQLNKLVNVIKVYDLTGSNFVEEEMALVKVRANHEHRAEILRLVDIFKCKVVDVSATHYIIQATGSQEKLGALLDLLKPIGIKEVARTGTIALPRDRK